MADLIVWKNQQIGKMRRDMDRLINRMCSDFGVYAFPGESGDFPRLELSETAAALTLTAELPGVNPEDLEISIASDNLTIRGRRKMESVESNQHFRKTETRIGSFLRTVRLPCRIRVEETRATHRHGVLRISMPKAEAAKTSAVNVRVE